MSNTPDIKVRGIRSTIPSGYILGRTDAGTGDPHLVSMDTLADQVIATGKVAGTGSAGSGSVIYPALTDGQLPIGKTGSNPQAAQLTAGTNITITNGPGSITIAASGGGGGGALALISTLTASASASLAWTGLTQAKQWKLVGRLLIPATNTQVLYLQVGTGAGPTWITSGYLFAEVSQGSDNNGRSFGTSTALGIQCDEGQVSNTGFGTSFEMLITTDNANRVRFNGTYCCDITVNTSTVVGSTGGQVTIAGPVTGIRLIQGSGNITSGEASLYSLSV